MPVPVLFVDDEEDIRFSFQMHFEGQFPIHLASNGKEALEMLDKEPSIGVAVTDIRMPEMNGLEFIRQSRDNHPDVGFIVVSGHGEAEQIIEALQFGARNYLRKPYNLPDLEEAIRREARRFNVFREERDRRQREQHAEQFITAVEGLTYTLPNDLSMVAPVAFRLAQAAQAVGICDENDRGNLALSLIEITTNAIEHGNLEIVAEEKAELKSANTQGYADELARRASQAPFVDRSVSITAHILCDEAVFLITDEGNGFDHQNLPDPTDPENLFLPSGRGIMLARTFMDEVEFIGNGSSVRLTKRKAPKS